MVKLYTLAEIAYELRYSGRDHERSVRRLFQRFGIQILRRDRGTFLVTEHQLAALVDAMKCSPSENVVAFGTSVARSASVAKPVASKNTLRDAIAERMRRHTELALKAS
jgi:hypothetical protein